MRPKGHVDASRAIGRDGRASGEEQMARYLIGALAAVGMVLAAPGLWSTDASAAPKGTAAGEAIAASDLSAQRRRGRRAPVRIIVYPRDLPDIGRSGRRFDIYPRPYRYEWPGPNAQRECIGWLAPEARLSGTVIVPRRRCWWVSG
jgi:hypothetical protein